MVPAQYGAYRLMSEISSIPRIVQSTISPQLVPEFEAGVPSAKNNAPRPSGCVFYSMAVAMPNATPAFRMVDCLAANPPCIHTPYEFRASAHLIT
jgi:hypothetical protein